MSANTVPTRAVICPVDSLGDGSGFDPRAPLATTVEPLLVDTIEAARLLAISPRKLWELTKRGEIRCKRIGRRVLYSREALQEFVRK